MLWAGAQPRDRPCKDGRSTDAGNDGNGGMKHADEIEESLIIKRGVIREVRQTWENKQRESRRCAEMSCHDGGV